MSGRVGQTSGVSDLWSWLTHLPQHVLGLDAIWIYVVCGSLVFLEDAIFIGFALPGETAAIVAGVASSIGDVKLAVALVVVVAAAIIGDAVGYQVGKHFFGPRVLQSRFLAKHQENIDGAQSFLRRRGGVAVFLGRFTAFFRAMMPALAGSAHMPLRRFLMWNSLGGIAWGCLWVIAGHLAGASYQAIEKNVGRSSGYAVLAIFAVLVVYAWVRSRRSESND